MQKFHKGDWVRVVKDLGSSMSHFESDCEAIIIGSYADQYPQYDSGNVNQFSLFIKGRGEVSWYHVSQLTLIEAERIDLLEQWKAEKATEIKEKSDLDWIFSHGQEVIDNPHGSSIAALAACFGLINMWGSRGEGFVWQQNAMGTMAIATPYLEKGDKAGWLENCQRLADEARKK
jgi:hypothetical protein